MLDSIYTDVILIKRLLAILVCMMLMEGNLIREKLFHAIRLVKLLPLRKAMKPFTMNKDWKHLIC